MSQLEHITPEQVAQYGVVAAPDRLIGKPQDNKAVFDRLVRELVTVVVNAIIDKTNELLAAESVREENEQDRVAAEEARVSAETERIAAEEAREEAEETRQTNELHRENQEQYRQENELARQEAEQQRADETAGIVAQATQQAELAAQAAQSVTDMARTAESWAVGGTDTREGEDTDNARYWAGLAQIGASGDYDLHVEALGAVGDGNTDDTTAIQNAITFAVERHIPSLSFSNGKTYRITAPLNVPGAISIYGNNATIRCEVASGLILTASGSLGDELPLGADVTAQMGDESNITIQTGQPHGCAVGQIVILQSQRDAMSEDSGEFWCGTPTGSVNTTQYAEVLAVNKVLSETQLSCSGGLVYPYYLANREEGVDTSQQSGQKEHSTLRQVHFLSGFSIQDLNIECYGQGSRFIDNTISLHLCADSTVKNVRIKKHGGNGRGFILSNCFNCKFVDCVVDAYETSYDDYLDAQLSDNHFCFISCWYCAAEGCASYHGGQSFDITYGKAPTGATSVACPSLFIAIRGCLIHQAMSNAATNHSGAYGCMYENCRFTNFGRGLSVRSPNTLIHGCTFSAKTSPDQLDKYYYAITISEPTSFGTRIENCVFSSSAGVAIFPGNSNLSSPPNRKYKGISISGNVFLGVTRRAIYVEYPNMSWVYENGVNTGPYTEYAKKLLGITVSDNLFLKCGNGQVQSLCYVEALSNGVSFLRNRFAQCQASNLISVARTNTDIRIMDNTFHDCSCTAGYSYFDTLSDSNAYNKDLDANLLTRNVYAGNSSTEAGFKLGNSSDQNSRLDLLRTSGDTVGALYSNFDSTAPGWVGWRGKLTKGSEHFSMIVAGVNSFLAESIRFRPATDNTRYLGSADYRWKDIYCASATINTSDRNQKTDIVDVPNEVLDAWGKVRYKRFLFSDAVEKKGEAARYHIGLIAQDIQEAFSTAGLNAEDYGLFCADTIVDENGQEKNVLGIRYSEALALECAYIRRRLDSSIFYQNI